jgi:hypothetical protein
MPETVKPKCPECGVELVLVEGKLPEECAACHFVLEGFPEFVRWVKAAQKAIAAEVTPPPAPKKRGGIFSSLSRKK